MMGGQSVIMYSIQQEVSIFNKRPLKTTLTSWRAHAIVVAMKTETIRPYEWKALILMAVLAA